MKKLILIFLLVALVAIGFQNRTFLEQTAYNVWYHSPCDNPIDYRIGNIDSRFNITQEEFLVDIEDASNIWNISYPKPLFAYNPKALLSVNLTYDERQSLSNEISNLDTQAQEKESAIKPEIADYEKKVTDFNNRVTKLNQEIDYWNSRGGAPKEEYKKLQKEQQDLQQVASELNAMANALNKSTGQYNSMIGTLNQTIDNYNEMLQYKPEEGIYISDRYGPKIIIYFYISKQELIHTLSHEIGHALGIGHINETSSIMFPRTNQVVSLSSSDLAALNQICEKRSLPEILSIKANYAISIIKVSGFKGLLDDLRRSNFLNPQ